MPVDFLTNEQNQNYGRYAGEPSPEQLACYFHLDDNDRTFIEQSRRNHNRLGLALQLCTVRFIGTFLSDPTDVPPGVVIHLSKQLNIKDVSCLNKYMIRPATHREHAGEIQKQYGYKDLNEQPGHFRLVRWLYTRAWLSAERPSMLFDLATARMVKQKILLPGVTVLARLVARVRDSVAARLWRILVSIPNQEQQTKLEELLIISKNTRQTQLDRLRKPPTRVSGPALVGALNRLKEIRALGIGNLNLARLPAGRIKALARYANAARAQAITRMPQERKIATLVAFAHTIEITAMDDALDVLDLLVTELLNQSKRAGKKERLRTIHDLDAAAIKLNEACKVIFDDGFNDEEIRNTVFSRIPREQLMMASATVETLTRPADDNYYKELVDCYRRVRRFLPTLLDTVDFNSIQAGKPVLKAMEFLASIESQRKPDMSKAPLEIIPSSWKRIVIDKNLQVDRRAYTLCTLERLQDSLRRRDVFVTKSERWGDPRAKLLKGQEWLASRPNICKTLGRQETAKEELLELDRQLDEAYQRTAKNFPSNASVRIENKDNRNTLVVTGLDKLEEPFSLIELRQKVSELLPRVDLPEVLLEVHNRTGFAYEFTHISERDSRVTDLSISVCAVLLAEACNIGLEPVVQQDTQALKRSRLSWIQQNYIRADTITRANAKLVDAQTYIPLAQCWGGGEVASADGLRFVTPVRTVNAGPNSKYFGVGRGITYYNFTSDQFTGFHGIVIPGTLRDSMFILEGLLEQQTSLNPIEIMADTAGVSDVVFGLFWLLGYQFSPRLADIGESKFWRIGDSDYGVLNDLARHKINKNLIERNWDDMLRIAGSLKLGTVSASELIRSLLRSKRPSTLARAIAELGRIPKTLYLLSYIDDEAYRRRILTQLNRGEGRHSVARAIFHGRRGEIRQRYREGQEDQLDVLGLVVNVVVLWNTLYMDAALNHLRNEGYEVKPEDIARLSPLGCDNVNFLGRYSFTLSESVEKGQMRPLRNPEEDEE